MFLISLIDTKNQKLTGIMLVVVSIVCPLMIVVLPGVFYYFVLRIYDDS